MKVSNKILWVAIGGLFACVVVLLIFIRVSAAPLIERVEPVRAVSGSKQPVSQSYPLKYFSGIKASGKWNMKLQRGETYSVEIEAPEYLLGDLKGSISGSGTVVYDGEIRDQEVSISGSGSVKRQKNIVSSQALCIIREVFFKRYEHTA
jgi:hypothetical protein